MTDFKGSQFKRDIILWGVGWYVAYPVNYRQLEEMMAERGVEVDHSSLNRWVLKYTPPLKWRSGSASYLWEQAGVWTRRMSASKARGSIGIERPTRQVARWAFS